MKYIGVPLASLVLLSACGAAAPADDELLPGNWKMSGGVIEMDVPGATPEQAKMFKSAVGKMSSQEQCVTAEEAKFDPESMSEAFKQGDDCSVGGFEVADGAIDGKMTCKMPGGEETEIAITGKLAPEEFTMQASTEMVQEMLPEGKASITIEVKGERLGDC